MKHSLFCLSPQPILSAETETAGSTDEAPRQKRRFRRKKYGSSPGRGSPARSPVRFYTDSSPRGLVKPKALKAGDDEPKSPGGKSFLSDLKLSFV